MVPVYLIFEDNTIGTNALLDIGSNVTLVRSDLMKAIGCKGTRKGYMQLNGIAGASRPDISRICSFLIKGKNGAASDINDARVLPDIGGTTRCPDNTDRIKKDFGIEADLRPFDDGKIGILIGLDHAQLICATEWKYPKVGGPLAYHSALGWAYSASNNHLPVSSVEQIHDDLKANYGDEVLR